MIQDFWRLLTKVGIMASVSHRGQRLDISMREDAERVASWTWRHRPTTPRGRITRSRSFRPHPLGWMVKVSSIERVTQHTEVVAIETESGRYIANDVLTHNCLPMLEAAAQGVPTLSLDVAPQDEWLPGPQCPTTGRRAMAMQGGTVDVFQADPRALAATIDAWVRSADVADHSAAVRYYATCNSWSSLIGDYRDLINQTAERGVRV